MKEKDINYDISPEIFWHLWNQEDVKWYIDWKYWWDNDIVEKIYKVLADENEYIY